MRVLKPGRKQRGWSVETVCTGTGNGGGGCGAKLLVEQGDLFKTTSQARDETTTYVTFRCSECGVLTDLGERIWPPHQIVAGLAVRNPGSPSRGARD
jgi:hypothetical protein